MIKPTSILASILTASALVFLPQNAQNQVLYLDNTKFLGENLDFGNAEVGNEISLVGTAATYVITSFIYQFDFITTAGVGSPDGSELADLRFYANDGLPWKTGRASPGTRANAPGTMLFDSGPFPIGGFTPNSGSLVQFFNPAELGAVVIVPRRFTWAVAYSGLSADETAGLGFYSPATVGTNFGEAWLNETGAWQILTPSQGNPAPVFGAIASGTPVPELKFSAASNSLVLSWPTNAIGFSLVSATNLSIPANWLPVSGATVMKDQNVVTDTISGAAKFYRLSLPLTL